MVGDADLEAGLLAVLGRQLGCPPRLRQAMVDAVLPGGGRLRPTLCLAVAGTRRAAQPPATSRAMVAAVALELLHCASLVHDDLPCFDDAAVRRGQPSIHAAYGEALATLVGDGLIMAAFAHLSRLQGGCAGAVFQEVSTAAYRMVWGQAQESEPHVDFGSYHGHKTGALFEAATVCGAHLAAESNASACSPTLAELQAWRSFGARIGTLYQMADDILDVTATHVGQTGKRPGQDGLLGRPNRATALGLATAQRAFAGCLSGAQDALHGLSARPPLVRWFDRFAAHLRKQPGLSFVQPSRTTFAPVPPACPQPYGAPI